MNDDTITLNLYGQTCDVTAEDAQALADVAVGPGWDVLLRVLAGFLGGTRGALENPQTPLDEIRALQGRLQVVTDLERLLREQLPAVLEALRKDAY